MDSDLQQAIELIKSGKKKDGGQLLLTVLEKDPQNISAWLWLSSCVNTDEQKVRCLKKVLEIDPNHQVAINALSKLLPPEQPSEWDILENRVHSDNLGNNNQIEKKSISHPGRAKNPSFRLNGVGIGIIISLALITVIVSALVVKNISTKNPQPSAPQKQPTTRPLPTRTLIPAKTPIPSPTHLPSPTIQPTLLPGPARRYVPVTNEGMPANYLYPSVDEYRLKDGDYYQITFEAIDGAVPLFDEPRYYFSAFVGDTVDNAIKKYKETSESFQVNSDDWKYEWSKSTYASSLFDESGQYIGYMGYFGEAGRVFRVNNVIVLISVRIRNLNGIASSDVNRIQIDLDKFTEIITKKFR